MLPAQTPKAKDPLFETISKLDADLFGAMNRCDMDKFSSYWADDLEFYQDKDGLSIGRSPSIDVERQEHRATPYGPRISALERQWEPPSLCIERSPRRTPSNECSPPQSTRTSLPATPYPERALRPRAVNVEAPGYFIGRPSIDAER